MPFDQVVITCEHGGNQVPPAYRHLFKNFKDMLATHRGFDFGALKLAEEMALALNVPLYASTVSRLLVDLNRSIGNPTLHSEATRDLPIDERRSIVDEFWRPHRSLVESAVAKGIEQGARVVHIASHSFTPELHGEVRNADIGLLYDSRRPGEGALARLWKRELSELRPGIHVRFNYPYDGKGDGLTSLLRKMHPPESYVGMEFELNQKHVVAGGRDLRKLRQDIVSALSAALAKFAETTPRRK